MNEPFLSGVIEGFYGRPWTFAQRHKLIGWLHKFRLNTYCHGPKDDLKHRVLWRDLLDEREESEFKGLITACHENNIRFIYAISPGWNHRTDEAATIVDHPDLLPDMKRRLRQLLRIGCSDFVIQFDDVPVQGGHGRFGLANWHSETCNALRDWLALEFPGASLIICPAVYCDAMAGGDITGCDYLQTLGERLHPDIRIFWTGPNVISQTITADHLREVGGLLKRCPLIWDNLHANDYDPARLHLGPCTGRTHEIRQLGAGVLLNPSCQFELNFVPLHTLGAFLESGANYNHRDAIQAAVTDWLPDWERLQGEPFPMEIVQVLVDCFHLPFENGVRADQLISSAARALTGDAGAMQSTRTAADRLTALFHELSTLKNRDLLDALWSPVWRLKDELELIHQVATRVGDGPHALPDFPRGIVRGGLIRGLQELTTRHPDGRMSRNS